MMFTSCELKVAFVIDIPYSALLLDGKDKIPSLLAYVPHNDIIKLS